LHLVSAGVGALRHWQWLDGHWQAAASAQWRGGLPGAGVPQRVAAAGALDRLLVVVALPQDEGGSGTPLLYTARVLDPIVETALPVATPSLTAPAAEPASDTPAPAPPATAVATAAARQTPAGGGTESTAALRVGVALAPVAALLIVVLVVAALRVGRARSSS
jgi:hypothetical protein